MPEPEAQSRYPRRVTRQITLPHPSRPVAVGGDAPITVQSMTITKTADVEGTLQQIYALAGAGADIVRCTCNELEAAEGLAQIVPRSPVPIVADIHHQYKMALAALEAGVHCLRLNPGNIRKPEHIKLVAQECKDRGIPIRIGVNGGSLHPDLYAKYGDRIVFWGGGVDTQQTLPFGTPDEVRAQVAERVKIFSRKHGFVFNTIHNIQCNTPTQNLLAMFAALGRNL